MLPGQLGSCSFCLPSTWLLGVGSTCTPRGASSTSTRPRERTCRTRRSQIHGFQFWILQYCENRSSRDYGIPFWIRCESIAWGLPGFLLRILLCQSTDWRYRGGIFDCQGSGRPNHAVKCVGHGRPLTGSIWINLLLEFSKLSTDTGTF